MTERSIGTTVAGYRLEEVIGRGGMGVVYRARDERLDRRVALKLIAPEQVGDASFRRRFAAESRAAAAIDHPNVLPVYEAGEHEGLLFLAARLVEGTDLKEVLRQRESLDPRRAVSVVAQVGAALDAAHEGGLVHRDVKPANVLVAAGAGADGGDHCYLTDFGLAKHAGATGITATGQFVGTLDYVAPEQIQGGEVDGRADVYALGAMLYECLVGGPPYVRDSHVAVLWAHLNDPPPAPSERRADLPPGLDETVLQAMAKKPDDRIATCGELAERAREALRGTDERPDPTVAAATPAATMASAAAPTEAATPLVGRAPSALPETAEPESPRPDPPRRGRTRRWLLSMAGVTAAALLAVLAASFAGGGDESGTASDAARARASTAALQLSTDALELVGRTGRLVGDLADDVAAGAQSPERRGLEGAHADAVRLVQEVERRMSPGAAGREGLRDGAEGLERTTRLAAAVATDPDAAGALSDARRAARAADAVLRDLRLALGALRISLAEEGATEAEATVGDTLADLGAAEDRVAAVFDSLVESLDDS